MSGVDARVLGAERAAPIVGACLEARRGASQLVVCTDDTGAFDPDLFQPGDAITLSAAGYVGKQFSWPPSALPLRLLEDRLIGYHDILSAFPGDAVVAAIHAPTETTATLYRHGLQKECISRFKLPKQSQQVPDGFFVDKGLAWNPSIEYRLAPDLPGGLYSLLLEAPGEESFALPLIVSSILEEADRRRKVLVLASSNNWQTYNTWGGRSRYRNFESASSAEFIPSFQTPLQRLHALAGAMLPPPLRRVVREALGLRDPSFPWMFDPLSRRRPFVNLALEGATCFEPFTNHLASGEWRVLAWLEREKIPFTLVSGEQLHRDPTLLEGFPALILSTHCEYFSREMFGTIQRAHEKGQWLINVSGNSIYREVEFLENDRLRCSSLHFSESVEDETQLIGVRFTADDYGTCAPYRATDPGHWAFAGIPLSTDRTFGHASLNQMTSVCHSRYDPGRPGVAFGLTGAGASGWETDKRSTTSPRDFHRIAKGLNSFGGADMLVREPTGRRGGCFTASSITFGGALLIDAVASGLLRNVIGRALSGGAACDS